MPDVKHKSQRSDSRLTPEARLAYPFVHEKRTKRANGEVMKTPRHEIVVLVPKLTNDASTCPNYAALAAHLMEAAAKAWPGVGWPQGGKWPIQDGDIPHIAKPKPGVVPKTPEEIAKANEWRRGHWVIEASHNLDPGPKVAVMQNGQAVEIPSKVIAGQTMYKSGDYGFVSIHAFTYQNETFGANFGFEGVLFTRPGEPIGSSGPRSAAQMFADVATVAAPVSGQPSPPMPPGFPAAVPAPPAAAPQYAAPQPPAPQYAAPAPAAAPVPPPPPGVTAGNLPPFPAPR